MGRTIWDDIRGDDTFKQITRTAGGFTSNTLSNTLGFITKFQKNLQDNLVNITSGNTIYIALAIGGGFVLIYGYSTITKK